MKRRTIRGSWAVSALLTALSLFFGSLLPGDAKVSDSGAALFVAIFLVPSGFFLLFSSFFLLISELSGMFVRVSSKRFRAEAASLPLYYILCDEDRELLNENEKDADE